MHRFEKELCFLADFLVYMDWFMPQINIEPREMKGERPKLSNTVEIRKAEPAKIKKKQVLTDEQKKKYYAYQRAYRARKKLNIINNVEPTERQPPL